MEVRVRRGRIESPDTSDTSDEPYGGIDLVHGMTSSLIDEDGSEWRVSSESEIAGTHRSVMGESTKTESSSYIYDLKAARNVHIGPLQMTNMTWPALYT